MPKPDIEPYLPYAFITGYVHNSVSNATIQDATVTLSRVPGLQDLTTKSDPTGYYFFELPELYYPDTSTTLTGSVPTYKTSDPGPLMHKLGYVWIQNILPTPLGLARFVPLPKSSPECSHQHVKYWQIIADNLKKAGWSLDWVLARDLEGRTIWIVDAHGYGKRFVVHADQMLTAFVELQRAIHEFAVEEVGLRPHFIAAASNNGVTFLVLNSETHSIFYSTSTLRK